MTTMGLDFVVIKDHRGFESGFFWSDVQQVMNVIGIVDESATVKVKFRNDHEGTYTLIFVMPLNEFLEQAKEQLNHPDTRRNTPNPYGFPPPPAAEFFEPSATYLFKEDDE